jgi:putative hemolysin
VLASKLGDKSRRVPRFVVSYLKHIIHQDWVNTFLVEANGLEGTAWLEACLRYQGVTLNVLGRDNLPAKDDPRRYTFVSNHPLGGIDGVALGSILGRQYDDRFRYLVNDLLMNLKGLAPLCIPINKTGRQAKDFPAQVEGGFHSDNHILMFPAGICSRRHKGEIHDTEWKKTFITKSIETQRDVVPIYFDGRNSNFFYRLSNISDRLIKKVNIAMMYLVDEMYKNNGKTFNIYIGKPIPWQTFDHSRTPKQWAQWVQQQVYTLKIKDEK